MTFKELGLRGELLEAIHNLGYESPTPIQQEAIPFLQQNTQQDLIALAQTGTGKTAAFSLPVLNQIDIGNKTVQCLILCPTRELCLQIAKDIESYTQNLRSLKTVAVYGGTSVSQQKKQLKKGAHIIVGTPGRTLDLIRQRSLDVRQIDWLVLDEADEMLNMGFKDDLEAILKDTPKSKTTLLFSATMPKSMRDIVNKFMNDPHRIETARRNIGAKNVEHQYYVTHARDRYATLQRLVDAHPNMYAIIFCRTRRETQQVADRLMEAGYNADTIHGDLSQNQRDSVMKNFKNNTIQLLVATDVAARGIDVDELTHVINYQLPDDPEVYVHRSGRTGRAGNKGVCMSIIHAREGKRLHAIEQMVGKDFERKLIPSGEEICEKQIARFLDEIKTHKGDQDIIGKYWPLIEEKIGDLSSDQIINRLLSIEISRFLTSYDNARDLNVTQKTNSLRKGSDDDGKRKRQKGSKWVGFELRTGSKDNMQPKRLIALINEQTDSSNIPIGEINVSNHTTFFEVDEKDAKLVKNAFKNMVIQGKPALVLAEGSSKSRGRSSSGKRGRKRGGNNRQNSRGRHGGSGRRGRRSR